MPYIFPLLPAFRSQQRGLLVRMSGAPLPPHRLFVSYGSPSTFFAAHHPRTGELLQFAVAGEQVLEIQVFSSAEPGSWMWEDFVLQDNRLYVATPIDPLFLLLPRLEAARGTVSSEHRGLFKPLSDALDAHADAEALTAHVASLPSLNKRLVRQLPDYFCGWRLSTLTLLRELAPCWT